jgi:hypothetical protein
MSENIERLRAQAQKCLLLAKDCTTPAVAKSLIALADDYLEHAAKLEARIATPPQLAA